MASSKYQRRHYETVAEGLKAKGATNDEIDQWIRKFATDNPRFRADYFRAAVTGGEITRRGVTRKYYPVSRPQRKFKVPTLAGYGARRCKFGKKKKHGRWICRKSRRK